MNIDNLKRLAATREEYSVTADPALYCDGHLICLSGDMTVRECRFGAKSIEYWNKTLSGADDVPVVIAAEMRGTFPVYVRYLRAGDLTVAIKEQFRRCFDEDAEFRASDRERQVLAYEHGALAGIIMPISTWKEPYPIDEYPIIPFVDDGALYHQCE